MLNLKNNFIMAPVKTGYGDKNGKITEKLISFYEQRAEFIGAITPEPLYLDKRLRELPTQIGIDSDDKINGLKKLTDSIHKFGTKVIAHLNHPGRMANPKIPDNYFVSSTGKACENGGAVPKELSKDGIEKVITLFEDAAKRAEKSGFDVIELQFGHGYLAAQFISKKINTRTDEYGGNFENRIKLSLEIYDAVKKAANLPIIVRISGDEMIPDGIKLPEMIEFAKILKLRGVSAIHVSAGTVCNTPPWYFQHMFVPKGKTWNFANKIKTEAKIPTIFVGQINTPEDINNIKDNYKADYIALGRPLVADPNIIGKYTKKIKGNIKPCLSCADGCLGGVKSGKGLQCLVNPTVGKENEIIEPTSDKKNIAIAGGGLAGMEAALNLHNKGHNVTIFEKNKLGGQFRLAHLTPNKKSLQNLISFYEKEIKEKKINVIYKEATKDEIAGKYDELVVATGSLPIVPKIEGLTNYFWAEILLKENLPSNKKILIIGGGLIGVDIATALIPRNNKLIIVKRTTDFGEDMEMIAKLLSLKMMKENGTVFSDHTHIQKIEGKTVYAVKNGENIKFTDIDLIVISTGMKSENSVAAKLENTMPIHIIGDAKKPRKAQNAITEGYEVAKLI